MDYSHLIWIPTLILFAVGLVGTVIPFVPGILFISCGILWQGIMGSGYLSWWEWVVLALLTAIGLVVDKVTGGIGAKVFGSAKAGIIGALVGAVIGPFIMTPLLGIIVAPFVGALAGELIFSRKKIAPAFKAGAGATLGMLAGMAFEFLIGVLLISFFLLFWFVV